MLTFVDIQIFMQIFLIINEQTIATFFTGTSDKDQTNKSNVMEMLPHQWPIKLTSMMFLFLTLVLAQATAQSCPPFEPTACGANEMSCPGATSPDGCPTPDMCYPMVNGTDGALCPG